MSLDINLPAVVEEQDNAKNLEKLAGYFENLVKERRKKEALDYFRSLDDETKRYIMTTKYKWALQAARMQV